MSPGTLQLDGGEPLQKAYRRAAGFLRKTTKATFDGDILIVGHGVTNALLSCAVIGAPQARRWEFPQPNARVTLLRMKDRKIVGVESLKDADIH